MRVPTIFEVLVFTLFEAEFPFRFPRAVGENGKRNWELAGPIGVAGRCSEDREIRLG